MKIFNHSCKRRSGFFNFFPGKCIKRNKKYGEIEYNTLGREFTKEEFDAKKKELLGL